MKYLGMVVGAALILAAGLATAGLRPALGQQGPDHRVTICHDVEGNGNTGNGYDIITVDKDAIVNKDGQIVPNGHGTHGEDAIPAFAAGGNGSHEWGAFGGQGNPEIIDNNCAPVTTTTEPPTTTTTTETTTTTTTTQPPTTTEPPPTTTETTTTTTTTAPPETQPSTTTETTTEQETTTAPPETTPPPKPPKSSPPKSSPPAKPKPPPACPPGESFDGKCGVQGNG